MALFYKFSQLRTEMRLKMGGVSREVQNLVNCFAAMSRWALRQGTILATNLSHIH